MNRIMSFALVLTLALMLFANKPASAQDYPVFEGFAGLSLANWDAIQNRQNNVGWHLSFGLNPHRNVRLLADFAGQYKETDIAFDGKKTTIENYQFMWGPEYTLRRSSGATPFVHALFGVAGRHYTTPSGDYYFPKNVLAVDYGFSSGFGGGVDIAISRRWAIRAIQADYVLTHMTADAPQFSPIQSQIPTLSNWQHSYRLAFGLVLRLGTRTAGNRL